jgi:hypothetical protein
MAIKKDYESWTASLRPGSEELEDLDSFAEDMGMTRQEATRQILIMWSRARRGKLASTYGFFAGPMYPMSTPQPVAMESPRPEATNKTKTNGRAAAAGITFDDDDE